MDIVNYLKEEILLRKQEAVEILRRSYSDDEIKDLCIRFRNAPADTDLQAELKAEGYSQEIFFAVVALCCLMYLEVNIPTSEDYLLSATAVSDLILTTSNAFLALTEAGWKPAEKLAITKLKMYQNQPDNRVRTHDEKDEIFDLLDEYEKKKKRMPLNLEIFLKYLDESGSGFDIDEKHRTINHNWRNPRAFGTIDNWMREYKKKFTDS